MKIAFCGTQGTGKTTMCYDLAACLYILNDNGKTIDRIVV